MTTDLLARVRDHIARARLFPEPGGAVLAVSGGPDSVALLDLLAALAPSLGLELTVAHVDHGIAPDSGRVADAVAALARRYGLPFERREVALGTGASETAARRARYQALRAIQRDVGARYLVTAHHADDQAETVLFRLLRGSGLAGLAGIPARGPAGLVRPLLPVRRSTLARWLERRAVATGQPFPVHDDPANADPRHDRSWLRQRVLPLLRGRFADLDRRLRSAGGHAARERRAWAALLAELPDLDYRARPGGVEVAQAPLQRYDKALSEAILRALAREAGCLLGPRRARRVAQFVRSSTSGRVLQLGKGWEAAIAFDRVHLVQREPRDAPPATAATFGTDAGVVAWDGWEFVWRSEPAGTPLRAAFTTWVTPGASAVRALATGDRVRPLGGVGRRKVRTLLMEARVPVGERQRYPVLVRDGDVWWVPGICRSEVAVPRPGQPAVRIEARAARRD